MLKVTIEDEQESRTMKCRTCITSTLNTFNNGLPVFKTLIEGEYTLEELLDLFASMSVEVFKTLEENTGTRFDYDSFMNNITVIAKKSMGMEENNGDI